MVNIDVRIDGTGSSLELPQEPESSLEASGDAGMAQELQPSPDMAMGLTDSTRLDVTSQAVSLGGVDNFSTIEVGESQIDADGPVDTLGIEAGRGIALTVDGKTLIVTATGGSAGMEIEIVQQLPADGEPGTLYLVPNQGTGTNVYDEYIWIESAQTFEMIGTTEVDLSGYVTDEELDDALASHTHPNATTTAAGFMSADQVKTLQQMEIFRAVCTGVQNVGGTCVCTVSAYKGLLQVSNGTLLIVQFNAAWQTDSAVELNIGASSNLTVCTLDTGGAWTPVSASNPLKWQTGSVMLFLCDWTNKKVLLLSRNLPIDAADIQTGTLDAARIPVLSYLPTSGGTLTGDLDLDGAGLTYDSETAYPTFIRSSWSTSSDESTLPVTPCFVLDTTEEALYWCSGNGIERLNPEYMPVGSTAKSGSDLNDQTNGEVWWGNNFSNAPNSSTRYHRVIRQANCQTAFQATSDSTAPQVWARTWTNNMWQPWVRVDNQQPSALTAGVSSALSLSTSYQKVTLAQSAKCGSDLSISSGGIKCGRAGHVLVAAQARFDQMTNGNLANLAVYKGSSSVAYASGRSYNQGTMLTIAPFVLQVAANDVIYLHAQNASAANGSIGATASLNRMTVMYLD